MNRCPCRCEKQIIASRYVKLQPQLIVLCPDCRLLGIVRSPSDSELERAAAAANDAAYLPAFTGSAERIQWIGYAAPEEPDDAPEASELVAMERRKATMRADRNRKGDDGRGRPARPLRL